MKFMFPLRVAWLLAWVPAAALAASGVTIYQAKCSACHDSGAGQAPRVSVPDDWPARAARGRAAIYDSAIKGIPATAMAAKGGFAELSDADVRAAVDYMLARVGFRDAAATPVAATRDATPPAPAPAAFAASAGATNDDDAALVNRVAETLRKALAPDARIEWYAGEATLRGINIRVGARGGVVTLSGAVEKSGLIPRAQAVAGAVSGVRRVENRLVASGMFDFD